MDIKPIHLAIGGAALYLFFRATDDKKKSKAGTSTATLAGPAGPTLGPMQATRTAQLVPGALSPSNIIKQRMDANFAVLPDKTYSPQAAFYLTAATLKELYPDKPWPSTLVEANTVVQVQGTPYIGVFAQHPERQALQSMWSQTYQYAMDLYGVPGF